MKEYVGRNAFENEVSLYLGIIIVYLYSFCTDNRCVIESNLCSCYRNAEGNTSCSCSCILAGLKEQ